MRFTIYRNNNKYKCYESELIKNDEILIKMKGMENHPYTEEREKVTNAFIQIGDKQNTTKTQLFKDNEKFLRLLRRVNIKIELDLNYHSSFKRW